MLHDDYLSCGQYENQPKHTSSKEFSVFTDVKTGKHYFALVDNSGQVLLRSEGYDNDKTRENGLKSVLTNLPNQKRYAVVNEGGNFFVTLKAANHREIGRSCPFATEAEAKAFSVRLSGKNPFTAPAVKAAAPKAEKAPVAKKEVKAAAPKAEKAPVAKKEVKAAAPKAEKAPVAKKEVKAVAPKVEKAPVAKTEAKAVAPKVEKTPVAKTEVKAAAPKAEKAPAAKKQAIATLEQEYNVQDFYLGYSTLTFGNIQTGYTKFVAPDGTFYFAVYNPDGSLYLGSVGYALEEMRDQAFVAVVQAIESADNYSVVDAGDTYFCVLCDTNGNELARSGAFGSFTEAFKNTPNGRVRAEVSLY